MSSAFRCETGLIYYTSVLCFALSTLDFPEGPPFLISFPFGHGHRKTLYQALCRWLDDILPSTFFMIEVTCLLARFPFGPWI